MADDPLSEEEWDDRVSLRELAALVTPEGTDPDRRAAALAMARKRDERFPEPREMAGRTPLFGLRDFARWYEVYRAERRDDGRTSRMVGGWPELVIGSGWRFDRAVEACRAARGLDVTRRLIVGLVALVHAEATATGGARRLAGAKDRAALHRRIRAVTKADTDLGSALAALTYPTTAAEVSGGAGASPEGVFTAEERRLLARVDAVLADGEPPAVLIERVLGGLVGEATARGVRTSPAALAALVVAVADPRPGAVVLDPAVGEAGIVVALADAAPGLTVFAQEIDEATSHLARARAFVHGIDLQLEHTEGGSLREDGWPDVAADLVVIDPPFVGSRSAEWLGYGWGHLAEGGRAVVVVPLRRRVSTLRLPPPDWRRVEAIVVGPRGLRDDLGTEVALWSLTDEPTEATLLVDLRGEDDLDTKLGDVRALLAGWRRDGTVGDGTVRAVAVTAGDLPRSVDELDPDVWFGRDTDEAVGRAWELATELAELANGNLATVLSKSHRDTLARIVKALEQAGSG